MEEQWHICGGAKNLEFQSDAVVVSPWKPCTWEADTREDCEFKASIAYTETIIS